MRATLSLADMKGGYLYQLRPDLFPEGYLSSVELGLWGKYYEQKAQRMKNG